MVFNHNRIFGTALLSADLRASKISEAGISQWLINYYL